MWAYIHHHFVLVGSLSAFLLSASFCEGSNFNRPHHHQGVVTPYEPKAPDMKLNNEALNLLKKGKTYKSQTSEGGSGRGIVVVDILAPTATVWSRILDFDNYNKMVTGVVQSSNYNVVKHKPSRSNNFLSETIYTRMKIGLSMVTLEYFVEHSYYPKLNILTWTLDYDKASDLDDSAGYWYLIPHPEKGSDATRVFYSVDANFPSWLPTFVQNFVSNKALGDATSWLKRESEKLYNKEMAKKNTVKVKQKGRRKAADGGKEQSSDSKIGVQGSDCKSELSHAFVTFLVFVLILYNVGLFFDGLGSKLE